MPEPARSKWRRLWRRRLRRRPLLPFVVAAYFALNVVAWSLNGIPVSDHVTLACWALFGAQISLLGAWVSFSHRAWLGRATIAIAGVWLAVSIVEGPGDEAYLRAVVLMTLGLALASTAVARLAARTARRGSLSHATRFRFTASTLLVATLTAAMLITVLRTTQWGAVTSPLTGLLCLIDVAPVAVLVYSASVLSDRHWRRIVLVFLPLAAVTVSIVFAVQPRGGPAVIGTPRDFAPYYSLQALLVGATLHLLTPAKWREVRSRSAAVPSVEEAIDVTV